MWGAADATKKISPEALAKALRENAASLRILRVLCGEFGTASCASISYLLFIAPQLTVVEADISSDADGEWRALLKHPAMRVRRLYSNLAREETLAPFLADVSAHPSVVDLKVLNCRISTLDALVDCTIASGCNAYIWTNAICRRACCLSSGRCLRAACRCLIFLAEVVLCSPRRFYFAMHCARAGCVN